MTKKLKSKNYKIYVKRSIPSGVKAAFHDTDILARIVARMSVSVSWNAALTTAHADPAMQVAHEDLAPSWQTDTTSHALRLLITN